MIDCLLTDLFTADELKVYSHSNHSELACSWDESDSHLLILHVKFSFIWLINWFKEILFRKQARTIQINAHRETKMIIISLFNELFVFYDRIFLFNESFVFYDRVSLFDQFVIHSLRSRFFVWFICHSYMNFVIREFVHSSICRSSICLIIKFSNSSFSGLRFASGTQALKFDNDLSTSLENSLRDQVHFISKWNKLDF
jgi:hypothetical protein